MEKFTCPLCGPITRDQTVGQFGEHHWLCDSPVRPLAPEAEEAES